MTGSSDVCSSDLGRIKSSWVAKVFHVDLSRVKLARKELVAQLVLLIQIDSDTRSGMGWGDSGRLYWMIPREDLAAKDFAKATFTWQTE